jgi:hypothetical protein
MVPSELTAVTAISGNKVWAVGSYNAADCCRAGTARILAGAAHRPEGVYSR